MPLSASVVRALRAELNEWKAVQRQAEERTAAIEAILAPTKLPGQSSEKNESPARSQQEGRSNNGGGGHETAASFAGLRDRIRALLVARPNVRPRVVIDALAAAGVVAIGKTSLETKVYNELYRMAKVGPLRKSASGGYSIPKGANSGEQGQEREKSRAQD